MQQRRMGRTGLKVSEICLGTMTFAGQCDEATSFRIMDAAVERGVTFFDTADVYPIPPDLATAGRTEEVIGRWFAAAPGRRDRLVLATKCRIEGRAGRQRPGPVAPAHPRGLRGQPPPAADRYHRPLSIALVRSGDSDRRDPARLRRPRPIGQGPLRRLLELRGLAARDGDGDERAVRLARYDCVQPRYNVLYREIETELLPLCRDQGVGVIVYNPLAGGFLTGKHRPRRLPRPGRGSPSAPRASSIASGTGMPRSSRP